MESGFKKELTCFIYLIKKIQVVKKKAHHSRKKYEISRKKILDKRMENIP